MIRALLLPAVLLVCVTISTGTLALEITSSEDCPVYPNPYFDAARGINILPTREEAEAKGSPLAPLVGVPLKGLWFTTSGKPHLCLNFFILAVKSRRTATLYGIWQAKRGRPEVHSHNWPTIFLLNQKDGDFYFTLPFWGAGTENMEEVRYILRNNAILGRVTYKDGLVSHIRLERADRPVSRPAPPEPEVGFGR